MPVKIVGRGCHCRPNRPLVLPPGKPAPVLLKSCSTAFQQVQPGSASHLLLRAHFVRIDISRCEIKFCCLFWPCLFLLHDLVGNAPRMLDTCQCKPRLGAFNSHPQIQQLGRDFNDETCKSAQLGQETAVHVLSILIATKRLLHSRSLRVLCTGSLQLNPVIAGCL